MRRLKVRHANIGRIGLALVAVLGALTLCACGSVGTLIDNSSVPVSSSGEKRLSRVQIADGYQKTSYAVGESFDPAGMYLRLTYTDGSTDSVPVSGDMLVGEFDTSDFTVEVTPPVYEQEPELAEPTSKQLTLVFSNEACAEQPAQIRRHTIGAPLLESEIPVPHAPRSDVYFDGWYVDPTFVEPVTIGATITGEPRSERYFYAHWVDIDYSGTEATFDARTALLCYDGEYTEFEYKVYKDVDEWYFDFEREIRSATIGSDVDLIYEVGDEFSTRGLYLTGGAYGDRIMWGMPVNKGMVVEFDTTTPGSRTVKLEFAGREFTYPITVTEKTLLTSEGVTVSDNGRLLNLSGNTGRYLLPENTYSVPDGFPATLNAQVRNNVREIVCPSSLTRVGDRAFDGMTRLESVTIGEGTLYIGDSAFAGCTSLKTLYVYASEPPYIMNSHFMLDAGSSVKIYVPRALLDMYVTSPQWSNYSAHIYAMDDN